MCFDRLRCALKDNAQDQSFGAVSLWLSGAFSRRKQRGHDEDDHQVVGKSCHLIVNLLRPVAPSFRVLEERLAELRQGDVIVSMYITMQIRVR